MASNPVPPEVHQFLESNNRTFLFTTRADGSPTCHPMIGLYKEGNLYFNTYRKSAKTRNAQRDSQATCLVTTKWNDPNFRAVIFRGSASVLEGQEMPDRPRPRAGINPVPQGVSGRSNDRLKSGKRILIEVTPTEALLLEKAR